MVHGADTRCFRPGCPCFFEKDPGMTYKRVPIFDNRGENILAHMESSIAFIEQVSVR